MKIIGIDTNIQENKSIQHKSFKGTLELSAGIQNNAVLNRGLLNVASTMPWVVLANNQQERIELFRNNSTFIALAFIAPILNVPFANRLFMRICGLTNGFGDNNHKAIQLSNKYLVSDEKLMEGLNKYNEHLYKGKPKISERFFSSPLEKVYKKLTGQQLNDKINIQELLKKCGGDVSVLRKRISKAKSLTLCSDLIITCASLGFFILLNNNLTQKKTGKKGYSAEFEMADKAIVEERAKEYEKNKNRNIKVLWSEIAIIASLVPLMMHKGVTSNSKSALANFIKKHCTLTDYTKGVFMSLFTTLLGLITNITGLLLFTRNKTERNNVAIRVGVTVPVMLGGDILVTSLIAKASDKLFKTNLIDKTATKNWFRKIFPKYKPLEQISKEIGDGIISSKNKKFATSIYWFGMAACAGVVALVVPTICNKLTKKDVTEYVQKHNKENLANTNFEYRKQQLYKINHSEAFKEFLTNN